MKRAAILLTLTFCFGTFADHPDHFRGDGTAFYVSASRFGKQNIVFYAPKVAGTFFLEVEGKEVASDSARLSKVGGRDVLYVQFTNVPGSVQDSTLLMVGTVLRGTNKAAYYGDYFTRKSGAATWIHAGGFNIEGNFPVTK